MSDDVVDCEGFDDAIAELALEILDPGERDALLAHVAGCERCSVELQRMSAAADGLTLLAPECEPPVGFEQRVMESLSAAQPSKRLRPVRPVRLWQLAAAAAILFIVGAAVGFAVHRDSGSVADSNAAQIRYGDLIDSTGDNHGSVTLVADNDSSTDVVLTMSLANLDAGEYHCVVHLDDGTKADLASWPIEDGGAGVWALPVTNPIDEIRGVSVQDEDGSTIAMTRWQR